MTALLLSVAALVAYGTSFKGVFLLDDEMTIVKNPDIRGDLPLWKTVMPPAVSPDKVRWRGPVIAPTLAINYRLGGLNTWGYHAFNLVAHVLVALVLFSVVRRILLLDGLKERFGSVAGGLALTISLIWLVHPLQIDSVTYISQRTESIMGLFYLLTLYCVIRGCTGGRPGLWFVVAVTTCGLGMLSKEVMATAPVVVLLFDRIFLAGSFARIFRKRWPLYAGLASTWGALIWLMVVSPHPGNVGFEQGVAPLDYAKVQCPIILYYLQQAFWPSRLIFDYGVVRLVSFSDWIWPGTVLAVLIAATLVALRYRPRAGFLGAWFFLILAPTSSFVPIVLEAGAERRMYLPLAALVVLVVLGAWLLLNRLIGQSGSGGPATTGASGGRLVRWCGRVAVMAVVLVMMRATSLRNEDYHSAERIWTTVIERVPFNWRAHTTLGRELETQGRLEEAKAQLYLALQAKPNNAYVQNNLGRILVTQHAFGQAIEHYLLALESKPDYALAHYNLGIAFRATGRLDEAITQYRAALEIKPDLAEAHGNLGNALLAQRKPDEAAMHYRKALEIDPDLSESHLNLGILLQWRGELAEAIGHFNRALEIDPDFARAHMWLGITRQRADGAEKARPHFREALRLQPALAEELRKRGVDPSQFR